MKSGWHALWDAHLVRLGALNRMATVAQDFNLAVARMSVSIRQAFRRVRQAQEALRALGGAE